MSGWIKIEKDLRDDVRVRRMALALSRRYISFDVSEPIEFDPCNACAFPGVTLALGALAQLWMHADSFARDDDTLDITANEIDELTGIKGFAEILPVDWLEILNEKCVKLPGFQQHNGTEARRKALTAKRVSRHRDNQKRPGVSISNASALPDQTKTRPRLEKTRPEQSGDAGEKSRAPRSPATRLPEDFELIPERRAIAIRENLDPERTFAKFVNYWRAASGAKARKHDWPRTWENWCLTESDRTRNNGSGPHKPTVRAKTIAELEAEEEARVQH